MIGGNSMQLRKRGIVIIVIGSVAGGFVAGYLGSRIPEITKEEKIPKTVAAVVEEPEYVKMDKLDSTVKEQVESKFRPYKQKLDSWDSEKEVITIKMDQHDGKLENLEKTDEYFHDIVEESTKRFNHIEEDVIRNKEEIQTVKEELGPGDKYKVQMVYANSQIEPKYNLRAYDDKLYIDDLLSIVKEWQKDDINRVAIVDRPHGKGKAVFFAGADNGFKVEVFWSEEGMDKLLMLSAINSIPSIDTISITEAPSVLEKLFEEYGNASLLPFKQGLKKPSAALLFGEEPEVGRHKGKYYVR
jgi:hypothetical protein